MKTTNKKLNIVIILMLLFVFLIATIFTAESSIVLANSTPESESDIFIGYSNNENIESFTKNITNNNMSPNITVLTHGLGGAASDWSRDGNSFAHNKESLI